MYGNSAGLLGFAGNTGPNQQNSYSRRAGVMGASNDSTGVAGASLNQPGGLPPTMRLTVIAITVLPVGVGVLTNLPPAAS